MVEAVVQVDKTEIMKIVNYLDQHHLSEYFEDAVAMLIQAKDLQPKINVNKHFQDYFQLVVRGTHVMHRDFRFISATSYNRACFINLLYKSLQGFLSNTDTRKLKEYHALIELICFDFPKEFLVKMSSMLTLKERLDSTMLPQDFMTAFQLFFFYQEFIDFVLGIFENEKEKTSNASIELNKEPLLTEIAEFTKNYTISVPSMEFLEGPNLNSKILFHDLVQNLLKQNQQTIRHLDKTRMSGTTEVGLHASKSCKTEPLSAEVLS